MAKACMYRFTEGLVLSCAQRWQVASHFSFFFHRTVYAEVCSGRSTSTTAWKIHARLREERNMNIEPTATVGEGKLLLAKIK
jgi:hypothetical protein